MNLMNHQIVAAHHAVSALLSHSDLKTRPKYFLVLNHDALQSSINAMRHALPKSEALQAFEAKRNALYLVYADKLDNGQPVMLNGEPQVAPARRDEFQLALSDLLSEYQEPISQYQAAEAELMAIETNIELFTVTLDILPEYGIRADHLAALRPIIEAA